ncbi:MAG: AraC family transcriptional regulator [Clostridia bacterium]|nr:AraC family transcriptional regulator [Clostridia bacterium]
MNRHAPERGARDLNRYLLDRRMKDLNPLTYGAEQCAPHHRYGPAVRPYYLLHYVFSGKGTFHARGQEYTVGAGDFFLILPGEVTTYEADGQDPWEYLWLGFDGELAAQLQNLQNPVGKLPPDLFVELLAAGNDDFSEWEGAVEQYIASALHRILAELLAHRTARAHYARRAETYIRTRYMQDITIEEIAEALSLDRRYLSRLFKGRYGVTMQEYLVTTRLNRAAELLREGYSVTESATLCGYSDLSNFSKMFHRRFGVSPGTYAAK